MEKEVEVSVIRMRGLWVLDPDDIGDNEVIELWGRTGTLKLTFPDQEYIEWLENQIQIK